MLSFFRINDPYRIIVIFLFLVVLRLPVLTSTDMLTIPELRYMVVGEKLAEGAVLYVGVWDSLSPLSAWVFWLIDELFGRSQSTYHTIATLLVFVQVVRFNRLMLSNKAYNENTYIPGLIYALLGSLFFDFFTLSPALIGMTFILMALDRVFSQIEIRAKRDEPIFYTGLFLGLATLCHLPYCVFLIAILLMLLLFSATVSRRYMLVIFGFFLPIVLLWVYYYLIDGTKDLSHNWWQGYFRSKVLYTDIPSLLTLSAFPTGYLLIGLWRIIGWGRFTNFQTRLIQAMICWILFSVIYLLITNALQPSSLFVLVPGWAFFVSHFLLLIRRRWIAEIVFLLLITTVVYLNLGSFYDARLPSRLVDKDSMAPATRPEDQLQGKKILVMGNEVQCYQYNTLATPYFNWDLAKDLFDNLEFYDNLSHLYWHLKNDPPEVIVDMEGKWPSLEDKIPYLKKHYRQGRGGMYWKIGDHRTNN